MAIEAGEEPLGVERRHVRLLLVDERPARPRGQIETQERGIGFQALLGRPGQALDNQTRVVVGVACLLCQRPRER
jgi:hypothetical protein